MVYCSWFEAGHTVGYREFESPSFRQASIAQLVEQLFCKQSVAGSSPATSSRGFASTLDMRTSGLAPERVVPWSAPGEGITEHLERA